MPWQYLIVLLLGACAGRPPDWPAVLAGVRARHPSVVQLSQDELATRRGDPLPLVLDARSRAEYEVSHLRGARPAPDVAAALAALAGVEREREIVVYCSVGERSSALAEELAARGFTRTANLEGGIFAWANADRPVFRGDEPVEQVDEVHPFDASWGELLAPARRAR